IVMPEQDAALAITAETPDMQEEINLVWQYLLPAFKNGMLPADADAVAKLKKKIKTLALPLPAQHTEALETTINGKTFTAASNDIHLQNISFNFSNNVCHVKFQTDTTTYQVAFGAGTRLPAETNMPEPALTAGMIENNRII